MFEVAFGNQLSEDPRRGPAEKELALHGGGDDSRMEITSFKKVVYKKLLRNPEFELKRLIAVDEGGNETTVNSLGELTENPGLTAIGVVGTIPVGCVSIGVRRRSDSYAQVVKS